MLMLTKYSIKKTALRSALVRKNVEGVVSKISGAMGLMLCLLVGCLLPGCQDDPVPAEDKLYIYGQYTNYTGQAPTFTIDKELTSESITYSQPEVKQVPTKDGDRIEIKIPNLKITIDDTPYHLDDVEVEEEKSSGWSKQEEFQNVDISTKNKLAVVMVLDMSKSLGQDVTSVKSYAKQFSEDFLNPGHGSLGLILFSENIQNYDFTTTATTIRSTIENYTDYRNATTLYGAMFKGVEMLDAFSQPVDRKVLLTFTDGGDNNTNNPTTVKNKIIASKHDRYMIGLRGKGGDYQEVDLKTLVTEKRNFVEADNLLAVDDAFDSILRMITTTSVINYYRTTQKFTSGVDKPVNVRLKLIVE